MGGYPKTWEVATPRGGLHVYFAMKEPNEIPKKTVVWTDGEKHSAIEVLGDGALITMPPSKRIVDGHEKFYEFLPGKSIFDVSFVPDVPDWVWKRVKDKQEVKRKTQGRLVDAPVGGWVGLAQSWGLKIAGPEGSTGWVPCYRVEKMETHPSASISAWSGNYVKDGLKQWISIWDLGVLLGAGRDWKEVKDKHANSTFRS